MGKRICVMDLPGLSRQLIEHVPPSSRLGQWLQNQRIGALQPPWPAVTCTVQATLTTGASPSQHGIVCNGLATYRSQDDQALVDLSNFATFRRDVSFWEQSNQLVGAPRFWQDASGKPRCKTALLFFQHSMPGFRGAPRPAADIVVTPKPQHGADGKLTSLIWTEPPDLGIQLTAALGPFPLMNYWGPMAGIASSQWIAKAAASVWSQLTPELQLTYIPHLDYDLQRFGPDSPQAVKAVVDISSAVEPLLEAVLGSGGALVLLSEYSMSPVDTVIHPNRLLADAGLLVTRQTPDGKLVDYAQSRAFAMVDHQISHVFARDGQAAAAARAALQNVPAEEVDPAQRIAHVRAGDIQLQARPNAWFDYRWWSDPRDAPAFAATVDIHRKPGYDPLELFFDPATRTIAQDASLVRGSHGRADSSAGIMACSDRASGSLNASEAGALIADMLV